jgi:hypothetical protein
VVVLELRAVAVPHGAVTCELGRSGSRGAGEDPRPAQPELPLRSVPNGATAPWYGADHGATE